MDDASRKNTKALRETVLKTIETHKMVTPGDHVLVGVSGGSDSVFLLWFFSELRKPWRLRVTAAHYHHNTRGEASHQDEAFVVSLCKRLKIPLCVGKWERKEGSLVSEEAAREARYGFFEECCRKAGANKIALAHTRDDDVETILFRLLRGTGLSGLRGIPYERPLGSYPMIRPLKEIPRDQIRRFLKGKGIAWREDASNQDPRYTRNRIRHMLLPLLEKEFNPKVREILFHLGRNVAEDYDYLQKEGEVFFKKALFRQGQRQVVLKRRAFQTYPLAIQKQLFRKAIRNLGSDMDTVGYATWRSAEALLGKKFFQYTLPGPLFLRGTPTKLTFALPKESDSTKRDADALVLKGKI